MFGLGEAAAIGAVICSGFANVIFKSQSDKIKPPTILFIRVIVGVVAFLITTLAMNNVADGFTMGWRAFLPLISAAILGIIIGDLLYLTSQNLIGVSKAYPIALTYPLLTYIFSIILFGEEFKVLKILGIMLVIVGVVLISLSKVEDKGEAETGASNQLASKAFEGTTEQAILVLGEKFSEENNEVENEDEKVFSTRITEPSLPKDSMKETKKRRIMFLGILMAILTSIIWASGTILLKFGLDQTDVEIIPINFTRMLVLSPVAFTIFISTNRGKNKSTFSWKGIGLISLGGLLGIFIGSVLYLWAVDIAGPSTTAAIQATAPIVATPLSILFLKEKVDWLVILGTILTISGLIIILLLG